MSVLGAGIGHVGRKAEKKTAKRLSGRQTVSSGALSGDKGDIELPEFLCENKSSCAGSMILERVWLEKISREALEAKRKPALTLQFTDGLGNPLRFGSWVAVPEDVFEMVKAIYAERMS